MTKGIRVLLEEEYGYRHWVWNTEMDEEELIKWFRDCIGEGDAVFSEPSQLHGRKKEISIKEFNEMSRGSWTGMFHDAEDSYLVCPKGIVYDISVK